MRRQTRRQYIRVSRVHGLNATAINIEPTAGSCPQSEKVFFIKKLTHIGENWTSLPGDMSGLPDAPNNEWPIASTWDVGIPGQQKSSTVQATPHKKRFEDHALVNYVKDNDAPKWYDPSYGQVYAGATEDARLRAFQDAAVKFYGIGYIDGQYGVCNIREPLIGQTECRRK
jgi:hypothetical protein